MDEYFAQLQTLVRKAFDPETISVTVGYVNDAKLRAKVVIRDEISTLTHLFHVNLLSHTWEEVQEFINEAAAKLGLIAGPDKIGNEIVGQGGQAQANHPEDPSNPHGDIGEVNAAANRIVAGANNDD